MDPGFKSSRSSVKLLREAIASGYALFAKCLLGSAKYSVDSDMKVLATGSRLPRPSARRSRC